MKWIVLGLGAAVVLVAIAASRNADAAPGIAPPSNGAGSNSIVNAVVDEANGVHGALNNVRDNVTGRNRGTGGPGAPSSSPSKGTAVAAPTASNTIPLTAAQAATGWGPTIELLRP